MAKFEQQRVLQSIANPNTVQAQGTMAVADVMQNFGQWGMKRLEAFAVKEAQESAQMVDPSSEAPDLRSKMTISGQAYNEVVLAGHMGATKVDNTSNLIRMTEQYKDNPQAFKNASDAYKTEMLNNVAPEIRAEVAVDYDARSMSAFNELNSTFMEKQLVESGNNVLKAAQIYADDVSAAARKGDTEALNYNLSMIHAQAEILKEMGFGDKAEEMLSNINERIDKQLVLGRAEDAIQAGNGAKFIQNFIDNPPKDENGKDILTPEQVDSYASTMAAMDRQYRGLIDQQRAGASFEQQKLISDLQIGAKNGFIDLNTVIEKADQYLESGWISGSERTSLINNALAFTEKNAEKITNFAKIQERISTGDGSIVVDAKIQDEYFAEIIDPMFTDNRSMAEYEAMRYVNTFKYIPKALKNRLRNDLLSDDPELIRSTALFIDNVNRTPGLVGEAFTADQMAYVDTVVSLLPSMAPNEAVAQARRETDPSNKARRDARIYSLSQMESDGDIDYMDDVQNLYEGTFGGTYVDAVTGDALVSEYKSLVKSHYLSGSSIERAKEIAGAIIDRNWGVFNGRAMKYPPQDFPAYVVPGSGETGTDYILDQAYGYVSQNVAMGEVPLKENIILVADERTAKMATSGAPGYKIIVLQDGILTPVLNDFEYFFPDAKEEKLRLINENKSLYDQAVTPNANEIIVSP